jgi:1,4-dihydroxy-2-naphthoyl-CoA synthase
MFITALFATAKLWKQPRCPTTDEWMKELWYMYRVEHYSAMRNHDMGLEDIWMQLEDIESEVSQDQKHKSCMFSLICGR